MAPAMIVARELDVRTVDTISVKSYDHQAQSEAKVLKAPNAEMMGDGTGILVVDDLVDSGRTLDRVNRWWILSSPVSARTRGFSFRGIWLCNMLSPTAARPDAYSSGDGGNRGTSCDGGAAVDLRDFVPG
jgi:hypothetical protein